MVISPQAVQGLTGGKADGSSYNDWSDTIQVSGSSAKTSALDNMSEREFADYEMREAQKLGLEADSTKYRRAYEDLVKAGLNPRLLLQSGFDTNGVSASSNYSYSQSKNNSSSNSFSSSAIIAGILLLAAKLLI